MAGQLRALIRPPQLEASGGAAAGLPASWWLRTGLDVLATTELAAVDYPQPGGLTWGLLGDITSAALATEGCADWSVCIYSPDLDPSRDGADNIISYVTQALTAAARRLIADTPNPAVSWGDQRQRTVMTGFRETCSDVPLAWRVRHRPVRLCRAACPAPSAIADRKPPLDPSPTCSGIPGRWCHRGPPQLRRGAS